VDLAPLVRALRPDVVHVHAVLNPAVLDWVADRPSLMTVQDHRYFCPTRGKWTAEGNVCREPMGRDLCAGCFDDAAYFDRIFGITAERLSALSRLRLVVLSAYMRDELVAAGLRADRIRVIPPLVLPLDATALPDGPACVLFAGRLAESKGVRDAVAAWRQADVGLPLVFAGTGPLRPWLEEQGLPVLGWLDRPRLASAYKRARAVLMPPRWQEPFGIVGLEALGLGVPVVAWDSGGIREWHPDLGLVAWGDRDGLARRLRAAVHERGRLPAGFEREALMPPLLSAYEEASGGAS
jgi:glycosyltransferase involved in cell wall biosynthesis